MHFIIIIIINYVKCIGSLKQFQKMHQSLMVDSVQGRFELKNKNNIQKITQKFLLTAKHHKNKYKSIRITMYFDMVKEGKRNRKVLNVLQNIGINQPNYGDVHQVNFPCWAQPGEMEGWRQKHHPVPTWSELFLRHTRWGSRWILVMAPRKWHWTRSIKGLSPLDICS